MSVLVTERVRTCCWRGYKCLSSQHALWAGMPPAGPTTTTRRHSVTDAALSKLVEVAWPNHMGCRNSLKGSPPSYANIKSLLKHPSKVHTSPFPSTQLLASQLQSQRPSQTLQYIHDFTLTQLSIFFFHKYRTKFCTIIFKCWLVASGFIAATHAN